jgi:hypothetical protein
MDCCNEENCPCVYCKHSSCKGCNKCPCASCEKR